MAVCPVMRRKYSDPEPKPNWMERIAWSWGRGPTPVFTLADGDRAIGVVARKPGHSPETWTGIWLCQLR